ncbi:hypothetical protein AMAG_06365 [Allomyces macrogynus ATCC 38327]|uniref:BRO domain-containing protein 1 n=1 Tax=Allomyces macrogynus (strain ATCC 38327) TaxID=578462 RepID=A0A0L0SGH0_ALLM3|nr:hypothetical protein AMAG_06365 [Allomyces macrogynus ATCC 38327]|eukprot:KNE61547.1 hypothetical protein AMAG_06365 [Allomyces macrogynus ATCC 38327]
MIAVKAKLYSAQAHAMRAKHLETDFNYAEIIPRLELAVADAKEAVTLAKPLVHAVSAATTVTTPDAGTVLLDLAKSLVATCTESLTRATKDNDVIYHAATLAKDALPPLDHVVVPQRLGFDHILPGGAAELQGLVTDLFAALIPLAVHEKASVYSEQKAQVQRRASELVEVLDAEAGSLLGALGLPKALEALMTDIGSAAPVSPVAEVQVREIKNSEIPDLYATVSAMASDALAQIQGVMAKIDQRESEDARARAALPASTEWTLPDLRVQPAVAALVSAQAKLQQAQARDALILADFQALIVPSSPDAAAGTGRDASLLDTGNDLPALVAKARDLVALLSKLKADRTKGLTDLKAALQKDDIADVLVLNAKQNIDEHIFRAELAKFQGMQDRLAENAKVTRATLPALQAAWQAIVSHPDARAAQSRDARAAQWERSVAMAHKQVAQWQSKLQDAAAELADVQDAVARHVRDLERAIAEREREVAELQNRALGDAASRQRDLLRDQLARMSLGGSGSVGSAPSSPYPAASKPAYSTPAPGAYQAPSVATGSAYQPPTPTAPSAPSPGGYYSGSTAGAYAAPGTPTNYAGSYAAASTPPSQQQQQQPSSYAATRSLYQPPAAAPPAHASYSTPPPPTSYATQQQQQPAQAPPSYSSASYARPASYAPPPAQPQQQQQHALYQQPQPTGQYGYPSTVTPSNTNYYGSQPAQQGHYPSATTTPAYGGYPAAAPTQQPPPSQYQHQQQPAAQYQGYGYSTAAYSHQQQQQPASQYSAPAVGYGGYPQAQQQYKKTQHQAPQYQQQPQPQQQQYGGQYPPPSGGRPSLMD